MAGSAEADPEATEATEATEADREAAEAEEATEAAVKGWEAGSYCTAKRSVDTVDSVNSPLVHRPNRDTRPHSTTTRGCLHNEVENEHCKWIRAAV